MTMTLGATAGELSRREYGKKDLHGRWEMFTLMLRWQVKASCRRGPSCSMGTRRRSGALA